MAILNNPRFLRSATSIFASRSKVGETRKIKFSFAVGGENFRVKAVPVETAIIKGMRAF